MIVWIKVDENGRVCSSTDIEEFKEPDSIKMDISDDFDFSRQGDYRIVDGALVDDPPEPSKEEKEQSANIEMNKQLQEAAIFYVRGNASTLTNDQAQSVSLLFEKWQPNTSYKKDDIFRYNKILYRVQQDYVSKDIFNPNETMYHVQI